MLAWFEKEKGRVSRAAVIQKLPFLVEKVAGEDKPAAAASKSEGFFAMVMGVFNSRWRKG